MKQFITLLLLLSAAYLPAQKRFHPSPLQSETLPDWAEEMYSPQPNVWKVDDGYRQWRRSHPDDKTTYTQFYKKWRRAAEPFIQPQGFIRKPTEAENKAFEQRLAQLKGAAERGGQAAWINIGPFETFNTNAGPAPLAKSEQANVYCIDQSFSNPDVVYCGTEGAEIFRSNDHGQNWFCVSRALDITSVTALEVHPTDPNIVLAGEGNHIRRSTDGGQNWETVFDVQDASPNEILFNPADPTIVLAATWKGLFRSTDGGSTWANIFPEACYDIEWKTDDPNTLFAVRNDPQERICRFILSSDQGQTWTVQDNGWYSSTDSARTDGGARIAVTKADPNRVYVILIGEAKAGDNGFIGLYRSDDGGQSWMLPNPPAGGPFVDMVHPNMASLGTDGSGFHQGYYNLGLDASDTNPDELLVGFLKLWRSYNGATSFECIGGYCGNAFNYVHPDCQEIEINGDDIWMTSDGGIEYSTDFFATHFARNRGITSSDFWGFGSGWNDDILVGGRYHNGNTVITETWEPGESLGLGGGEASTGYVNPSAEREAYFSDIGGRVIPVQQNGFVESVAVGKFPNESYYDAESGEMEWDPRCWNVFYVTNENKIWKTQDGGSSWTELYAFGTDVNARAMGFEISRSNPDVMYLFQRAAYSWDPGILWKTVDGGQSWNQLPLPTGYARRMLLTLNPEDENTVWAAYPDGNNGEKIFKSTDGGQSWQNLSTPALNDEHISYIMHQGGTDGGVYLGTYRTIWYKNNQMAEWFPYNDGLPKSISTCILRPFYRDGKLRLGAYGKGIWEAPFFEASRPVAQPMVIKRLTACPGDTLQFDDYSMLRHAGATWNWAFPGGTPATATSRNPRVIYNTPGAYSVTLSVSNAAGTSTKTVEQMVEIQDFIKNDLPVQNDFSHGLDNLTLVNPDGGLTWEPVVLTTCNPAGDTAYFVNNFIYSNYGQDELLFPVNLDLTQIANATLSFRVAYAPYYDGNAFIDSLKVLISDNCGSNFKYIFRSGGEALSTTTTGLGPNNLYEIEAFSPASCEEWRNVSIDLSAYSGKYVTIKFLNQSGYGNNMYLDDINLNGQAVVPTHTPAQVGKISVQPNPASGTARIVGMSESDQDVEISLQNTAGQLLWHTHTHVSAGAWAQALPVAGLPTGLYWVKVGGEMGEGKVMKLVVKR